MAPVREAAPDAVLAGDPATAPRRLRELGAPRETGRAALPPDGPCAGGLVVAPPLLLNVYFWSVC